MTSCKCFLLPEELLKHLPEFRGSNWLKRGWEPSPTIILTLYSMYNWILTNCVQLKSNTQSAGVMDEDVGLSLAVNLLLPVCHLSYYISSFRLVRRCTMWRGRWRLKVEHHSCTVLSAVWSLVPSWWSWTTQCTCSPQYVPPTHADSRYTSWVKYKHEHKFTCIILLLRVYAQIWLLGLSQWSRVIIRHLGCGVIYVGNFLIQFIYIRFIK